jgi:hypothetical protein
VSKWLIERKKEGTCPKATRKHLEEKIEEICFLNAAAKWAFR